METQQDQPQTPESPDTLHRRVPSSAMSPKLDQDHDSTNSTHARYENTISSYDRCRVDRKRKFLAAQQSGASITDAALIAGVHRTTPYFWRDQDPEFAQAWRDSRDSLIEGLEMEAFQRAAKGNDRLLMFLLKSLKPDTYNERLSAKSHDHRCVTVTDIAEKVRKWL